MMDLLKLKYFHTVALLGNMTRAAEALHISQPSLSIMIRKLEEEIGVPLFDRVGRGIVLNSYGAVLLEHTNRMISELEKATYEIDVMKRGQERAINICGNVESLTSGLLNRFFQKTSDYRVRQRVCSCQTAEALLLKKDYQFAITMPALQHEQLRTWTIYSGGILACYMSVEHPLACRKSVSMDQIKHENFVSAFREEISTINARSFFETTYGFTPHIIYEGNKPMVQALLRENKGILVSLRFENALIEDPKIVMRPIDDEMFPCTVGLSWLKSNNRHAQCQYFIQFAKKYFTEEHVAIKEGAGQKES